MMHCPTITRIDSSVWLGVILLVSVPVWSQEDKPNVVVPAATGPVIAGTMNSDTGNNTNDDNADRMLTPPPVSGQSYPVTTVSQERSNYLRGGLTFLSAYSDNVLGATGPNSAPVSDVSYSVWPTIALDETTTRMHAVLTYAPGFTFYQRNSTRNEADENASINFQYRLSQHVTFSAVDGFQKSSNVFNQPDLGAAGVSGGAQTANFSVIAPIADRLSNSGNVGITYQFAANEMVGASGAFTNLHYSDQAEVPGLFDAQSQGGSAFYSFRASQAHYLGVSYQYQRLLTFPTQGQNETETQTVLLFYTFQPSKRFSISMFGGPQYSNIGPQFSVGATTTQPGSRTWTPAGGASMNWQGQFTSLAASYLHSVTGGGGLINAVHMDAANASLRQQLARSFSASLAGGYVQNEVVGGLSPVAGGSTDGHTISGTASVQRLFGEHLNVQLGYTRLHQSYNVAAISTNPDTNREFVSITYQFARPLGR
jgi:hypothetical protein